MTSNRISRVLVVTPNAFGTDGVSSLTRQTVRAFTDLVHPPAVELWSLNESGADERAISNAPVDCCFAAGSKLRMMSWGLGGAVQSQRDALVVLMHLGLSPVVLPCIVRGAQLAVYLLGIEAWRPLNILQKLALRQASATIAISEHTSHRFAKANPEFADHPISVCHLGVTAAPAGTPAAAVGNFGLIVGRMSASERYKGHDQLLEVWPDLLRQVPDARLLIAGDGDDRSRLEAKAAGLGLTDAVRFVGRVSDEQLAALYRDCAFFVMPSRDEGFGLVFLEAMRAGKACIGGIGAAAEIIAEGRSGLVVDPADRSQLMCALERMFLDCTLRDTMGSFGRELVAERFTEQHFHRRLHATLGAHGCGCA